MGGLCDVLKSLVPTDVACAAGPVADHSAALFALEHAALVDAVPKRRREFSSGRVYARAALAALNCPRLPISVGRDRQPHWPRGYIGSISHSDRWCVAVAGRDDRYVGIGVDIDSDAAIDAPLRERICRFDEEDGPLQMDGRAIDKTKAIFVLKEAVYKAYYPGTFRFLDFHDIRVTLVPPRGLFHAEIVGSDIPSLAGRRHFSGHFGCFDRHLVAAVAIASG
jgi:4'-phosphopantetheinyl transferase EntD